ncbi:MAG: amino acid adenylation domain-containing protein [Bacteroidales bacterium]|nr:amino acid adenylation domain-containing protein [Bacteroidales bacterium]
MDFAGEIGCSLAGRFWEATLRYGSNPALELGDRQFTYMELYQAAASLSHAILDLEDPNPYVGIMADKSFTCYAGILGILMAGKAYLPLNPRFPAGRNRYMLEKARTRVIIAGESSDDELEQVLENYTSEIFIVFPEETGQIQSLVPVPKIVSPGDPAYLLFTSGTTGNPKGVPVTNGNVASYLDNMQSLYEFGTADRFTQLFDLTFDLSVHDLFLAWSSGACLVVPGDNSSFAMARFIREKQPTVWFSVPSVVMLMDRMRLLKAGAYPSVRLSFFCGEALQDRYAKAWQNAAPGSRLVNLYGPTEATIAISHYELPGDPGNWKKAQGIISIGRVFNGNSFMLRSESIQDGPGELCLSGSQVVSGYFEHAEADRDAFFIDADTGENWYKTGDLVKIDGEGDLFFTGRKDAEVKISGYRVNLKEIENVISGYDLIEQAVVVFEQAADGQGTVIAFVQADKQARPVEKDLDAFCRLRLPWYMVPGKFIFVEDIPLNVNGKTDQAALLKIHRDGK